MLLPHGYEGQGPEHSSARLERFLQLCAENNLQVCYPTTPAQYFHLLRRQIRPGFERPLIVMTPKSLLRLPAAASALDELTSGGFRPLINDAEITNPDRVERVALCSGKVFYDLNEARKKARDASATEGGRGSSPTVREGAETSGPDRVAIVRVEQFYPFPQTALTEILNGYPNAKELVWCQEEPKNMGGWTFMEPRLENLLTSCERPRYVGREASASPATGSYAVHTQEQTRLVKEALAIG
jgi:2-oxoglutarate dehydrogenase E1 component